MSMLMIFGMPAFLYTSQSLSNEYAPVFCVSLFEYNSPMLLFKKAGAMQSIREWQITSPSLCAIILQLDCILTPPSVITALLNSSNL